MTKAQEESGKTASEYDKMMEIVNAKIAKIIANSEQVGVLKAEKYVTANMVRGRVLNNESLDLFADIVTTLLSYKGPLK